jgi:uncharacterized protein YdhG (YjbR/CyaY superfamily)
LAQAPCGRGGVRGNLKDSRENQVINPNPCNRILIAPINEVYFSNISILTLLTFALNMANCNMNKIAKNITTNDIDKYLANIPKQARITLEKLRKIIRAAAPKAEEKIGWGMPMFKYQGNLVGFAAFKNHYSLFPMSLQLMDEMKNELKKYDTTKGSIHFPLDKPLPVALVKKIVKERIKENEARIKNKRNGSRKS